MKSIKQEYSSLMMIFRLRVLAFMFTAVSLLLGACLSSLREYQVQEYHYYGEGVPPAFENYRIALVSDIHVWDMGLSVADQKAQAQARFDYLRLQEIGFLLRRSRSDLLLLAGDYVSFRKRVREDVDLRPYLALLPRPRDGIVAVLGNHDHFLLPRKESNPALRALRAAGATVLLNRQLQIVSQRDPSQVLHLVGLDDFMFGVRASAKALFAGLEPEDFVIALAHNPDSFDLFARPELVDMALAGHLHGGQVTLFGLALTVPAQRKYLRQPFQTPYFPAFVSNGLGASRLQFRLMAPPQIWTIVLHSLPQGQISKQEDFWHAESRRLRSESNFVRARMVPPRYRSSGYRIVRLGGPAQRVVLPSSP
ncbi:MAG: metallophosphoesterase [Spirochaetota bacterium]